MNILGISSNVIFTPVNELLRSTHKYSSGGGMDDIYMYDIPDYQDNNKTGKNFAERDVYISIRLL